MMKLKRGIWRRGLALVVSGIVLLSSAAPAVADEGQLTVTDVQLNGYPTVTVRFTATTAEGLPLGDLTAKDVRIFENGADQGQLVVYPLAQTSTPLAIALAVDTSGSMLGEPLTQAKQAARTFISELRSRDQMAVVSFGEQVSLDVPFPKTKKTLDRSGLNKAIDRLSAKGDTRLYDAVYYAVSEVAKMEGSRAVVILTDGEDTRSAAGLQQAIDLAVEQKVPVYTIGLGPGVVVPVLETLAAQTGGRYAYAPTPQDLSYVFRLVSQQIHNQYEMYYMSSTDLPVGSPVKGRLVVTAADQPALEVEFSYAVPTLLQRQQGPQTSALRPVDATAGLLTPEQIETLARLAGILIFCGVLAFFAGVVLKRRRDRTEARLRSFVQGATLPVPVQKTSLAGRAVEPAITLAGRLGTHLLPAKEAARLRQNLVLAGRPFGGRLEHFMVVRVVLSLLLGLLLYGAFLRSGALMAFLMGALGLAIGFLLPQTWLGMRIKSRQNQILRALPDALDLLVISVEAGIGFDGAVMEVCQKWRNPLTEEFAIALQEIRMGRGRREALKDMAARTGVPEVSTFVSAIIQANELGVNIAHTLNVQAQQMRIRRRQRAEELAHQAAVKMLIPMVFLIFPALFVVILGPAVPSLQSLLEVAK